LPQHAHLHGADPAKRLIPLFHYALSPGGFLLLGNSETAGEFKRSLCNGGSQVKLYRKKELTLGAGAAFKLQHLSFRRERRAGQADDPVEKKPPLREITERMLLRNHAPACVAVNEQGEILYIHGKTGKYLELPAGDATLNLVRAARDGLKIELANALRKVVAKRKPVRYEGLEVRVNGGFEVVNVTVELADGADRAANVIIVTFQDGQPKAARESAPAASRRPPQINKPPDEKDRHIAALERELLVKTEALQKTVEEMEASNEELKSTNEELQSANEELQSTNEELETSKEELQSVNEELVTVNTELQQKMESLSRINNDMNNLLAGTGIGMLFVDHNLRIQRFTPATTQLIKLIPATSAAPSATWFPTSPTTIISVRTSKPSSTRSCRASPKSRRATAAGSSCACCRIARSKTLSKGPC